MNIFAITNQILLYTFIFFIYYWYWILYQFHAYWFALHTTLTTYKISDLLNNAKSIKELIAFYNKWVFYFFALSRNWLFWIGSWIRDASESRYLLLNISYIYIFFFFEKNNFPQFILNFYFLKFKNCPNSNQFNIHFYLWSERKAVWIFLLSLQTIISSSNYILNKYIFYSSYDLSNK